MPTDLGTLCALELFWYQTCFTAKTYDLKNLESCTMLSNSAEFKIFHMESLKRNQMVI